LLRGGADIGARDSLGNTPLHIAARTVDLESARALLAAHADPNAQNLAEQTPLRFAVMSEKQARAQDTFIGRLFGGSHKTVERAGEVVTLLKSSGANIQ
jgi:hypothetical protein